MQNEVILFNDPDNGSLSIVYPNADCGLSLDDVIAKSVPSGVEHMVINRTMVPDNGILFDALTIQDSKIIIDTNRAEEIIKNKWRERRRSILLRYDLLYMRALETGDTATSQDIASKKQILRDVTQTSIDKWIEGDTVETYSQRILLFTPACLTW